MKIPLFQVDAFADRPFEGNPAAVCPLESWLDDRVLQSVAAENNLSETAFFVPGNEAHHLRWFTPRNEVDLCGHATLATAWVILERLEPTRDAVIFETRSGRLQVVRGNLGLTMDFPSRPPERTEAPEGLVAAVGGTPTAVLASRDVMLVYRQAHEVRNLSPDMAGIEATGAFGVIATAPGDGEFDVVSRFFAPAEGIPEDPVTGSAHCTIVPYWADRLGRPELLCRQASSRGGTLRCRLAGDRVSITGNAVGVLEGILTIPD
jgi:PhzF family phenazine biosynthesis protein